MKRAFALFIATIGMIGVTAGTSAGDATARPAPAQTIDLNGQHFRVDAGHCHGTVRVRLLTDRSKPGRLTLRFTPRRFTRTCATSVWVAWDLVSPGTISVPLRAGRHGGPTVTRTYRVGSGVHAISAGHRPSLTAVTFYGLVP